jgi:hypothetical protein
MAPSLLLRPTLPLAGHQLYLDKGATEDGIALITSSMANAKKNRSPPFPTVADKVAGRLQLYFPYGIELWYSKQPTKKPGVIPRQARSKHVPIALDRLGGGNMSETDLALGRIKKALDDVSGEISHGKYPAPILSDFKRSVDQLRLTIWAFIEAEDQRRKELTGSPMQLNRKLVEFRIKRLVEMLNELRGDLSSGAAAGNEADLKRLAAAMQNTLQGINQLAKTEN